MRSPNFIVVFLMLINFCKADWILIDLYVCVMKRTIFAVIGFVALMLLWQFGCTSVLNFFPKKKYSPNYQYEYVVDSTKYKTERKTHPIAFGVGG